MKTPSLAWFGRVRTATLATVIVAAAALATALAPPDADACEHQDTAPYPRRGKYAGKAECIRCHGDEADAIASGYHTGVVHSPALMGCESCHGPGHAHATHEDNEPETITYPPLLEPKDQARLCGRCHGTQIEGHGGDLEGMITAGIGCTECHGVHESRPGREHPDLHLSTLRGAHAVAEAAGSARCVKCHPRKDAQLATGPHAKLAKEHADNGCETCHGPGSLHVATDGLARLITRPDVARDGTTTCRSCHEHVDPIAFHWKDRHAPLLSKDMTCTTCHAVHEPRRAPRAIDGDTGQEITAEPKNRICATCHEPAFGVLVGTIHSSLGRRDIPLADGCGSCHAGAEQHALSAGRKDLVESLHGSSATVQRRVCTQCHDREPTLRHVGIGAHHKNEVSCLSCHSPAAKKTRMREDAEESCASCHAAVAAEFKLPNRHPVGNGKMFCSDCHDPHSARRRIRDHDLREGKCVDCHKQYRGPFVFEHQASRSDGCVVCHRPHGSPNRRMLEQVNTQQNCIACHGDFPSFHDQSAGSVFTNCLRCHTRVHGSNHSRFLFR